jgi:hypothetical protein
MWVLPDGRQTQEVDQHPDMTRFMALFHCSAGREPDHIASVERARQAVLFLIGLIGQRIPALSLDGP